MILKDELSFIGQICSPNSFIHVLDHIFEILKFYSYFTEFFLEFRGPRGLFALNTY